MKTIVATFEAENSLAEGRIWNDLQSLNAKTIRTLPNTDHLKDDKTNITLIKAIKKAKDAHFDYVNNNRCY